MANKNCIDIEQMLDALELPADHPRRRHLETCPRCGARLASLRSFLEMSDLPAGVDLENADRRLGHLVHQRIVGVRDAAPERRQRPGKGASFLLALIHPLRQQPLRPVAALLAIVIAVVGIRLFVYPSQEALDRRLLRGPSAAAGLAGSLPAPRQTETGGLIFTWPSAENASTYRLTIYRADMSEVAAWATQGACSLRLDTGALSVTVHEPGPLYWDVTALRGPDEIERSPLRVLRIPR